MREGGTTDRNVGLKLVVVSRGDKTGESTGGGGDRRGHGGGGGSSVVGIVGMRL